jgi:hypothetical protein
VSPLLVAGYVLSITATVLAWAIVPKRPDHRPVALLLSLGLAADLVQRVLVSTVLDVPGPYQGGARVAFHLQEAAFVAWPFGVVAAVVAAFPRRRPWPVLPAWALAVLVLAAGYPAIRGDVLRKAYLAIHLGALAVALGVFLAWIRHRQAMGLTRGAVLAVLAVELFLLFGPYRGSVFTSWAVAQGAYVTLYAALSMAQGVSLWDQWKGSRSG